MEKEVKEWIEKIEKSKKGSVDLSTDEDLSIALMNLVSLEEHFYFTAMKTENQKYLDMQHSVRELRKKLLGKIVIDPKGEEWCISKHLLAASIRLVEVGNKEFAKGNKDSANTCYKSGFDLWSLFFAINLKMIGTEKIKTELIGTKENKTMSKFSKIMKKVVDCCKEW